MTTTMKAPALSFLRALFLLAVLSLGQAAHALEALDRINQRRVDVLSIIGNQTLGKGSLLELGLEDTREIITGEVLAIRRVGHDLELEILDRQSNTHFFIEFPADGLSEIQR